MRRPITLLDRVEFAGNVNRPFTLGRLENRKGVQSRRVFDIPSLGAKTSCTTRRPLVSGRTVKMAGSPSRPNEILTSMPRASDGSVCTKNPFCKGCAVMGAPGPNCLDLAAGIDEKNTCIKALHLNFMLVTRVKVE